MTRRLRSVRAQLVLAATAASALVVASASAVLLWRFHQSAVDNLDNTVQRQALAIAANVDAGAVPSLPALAGQSGLVQVVDGTGAVVAASANVQGEPRLFSFSPSAVAARPRVQTRKAVALDAASYRVAAVSSPEGYTVYVGMPLAQVTSSTAALGAGLAVGAPALTAIFAALTWLLAGRALRPVERLRQQAADISGTDLHRRVDVPDSRDELASLASTLNELLARIDASVQAQRQFVASAAHELRSPVATLRAQLEAAAIGGTAPPVALLTAETIRLTTLVDDLLALARLDARPRLRQLDVDLDDLVRAEVALLRERTALAVDTSAVDPARVTGDPAMLVRLIRNLLDNAARHARVRITVELQVKAARVAVLVVADDGPGVPVADRERIFERFTRLDDSRDRDSGGVGLGLAIVRDIAVAHGGTAAVADSTAGARFVVRLPVRPEHAPPRGPADHLSTSAADVIPARARAAPRS